MGNPTTEDSRGWRTYEIGKWDYKKGVRKEPAFRPVINGEVYKRSRAEEWPEEAGKTPVRIRVEVDPTLEAWEAKVLMMGLIAEMERAERDAKRARW